MMPGGGEPSVSWRLLRTATGGSAVPTRETLRLPPTLLRVTAVYLWVPRADNASVSGRDEHGVLGELLAAQQVREVMSPLRGHLRASVGSRELGREGPKHRRRNAAA